MGRLIVTGTVGLAVAAGCTPALHRYSRADVGRVADHDALEQHWGLSKSRNLATHVLDRVDPGTVHIAVESTVRLLQLPADEAAEVPGGEFREGIQRFEVVGRHGDWLQVVEAQWCVPSRHRAWRYVQRAGFIRAGQELSVVATTFDKHELGIPAGTIVRQREGRWQVRPDDTANLWISSAEDMALEVASEYHPHCPEFDLGWAFSHLEQVHGRLTGVNSDASIIIREGDSSSMVWMWGHYHDVALRLRTQDELGFEPDPPGQASFMRLPCGRIERFSAAPAGHPEASRLASLMGSRRGITFDIGQSVFTETGEFIGFLWGDLWMGIDEFRRRRRECITIYGYRPDERNVCLAQLAVPYSPRRGGGDVEPYWLGWIGRMYWWM